MPATTGDNKYRTKPNYKRNFMIQFYKRVQKVREKYMDTLAKLYDYGTAAF